MYTMVLMTAMTAGCGATDFGPKIYLGSGGCRGDCNCGGYDPAIQGWPGYGSFPTGGYTNCWGGCSGWYPGGGFITTPGAIPRPDAPRVPPPAPPPNLLPMVSAPTPPLPARLPPDRARVIVELPADAKLYLNDLPTRSTTAVRSYLTPALQAGETYYYVVRVEMQIDGQAVTQTKRVLLHPGEEVRTRFSPDGPLTAQAP